MLRVEDVDLGDVAERLKLVEDSGEVGAVIAAQKSRNVLNEEPLGHEHGRDSCELMEEAGPFPGEAASLSGDGEVLARSREASAEQIDSREASNGITSCRSARDFVT